MKSPLCKYGENLDVIEYFKSSLSCKNNEILVPFASRCYFFAPLFKKFNFHLNFIDDGAYYFWDIYKEDRTLFSEMMEVFGKYKIDEDRDFIEERLAQETKPAYKALLFLMASDKNFKENFNSSFSLEMKNVQLSRNLQLNYSDFIIHSYVGNFKINDDSLTTELNKFKSKIIIADNPFVANVVQHDHKFDFENCYLLVSTSP